MSRSLLDFCVGLIDERIAELNQKKLALLDEYDAAVARERGNGSARTPKPKPAFPANVTTKNDQPVTA